MICPKCHTYNQPGVPNCINCGQALPPVAASFPVSPSNNGIQTRKAHVVSQVQKPKQQNIRWSYLILGLFVIGFLTLGTFSVLRLLNGAHYIAFQTENLGKYDLWLARENGSQQVRIFENAANYTYPLDYSRPQLITTDSTQYAHTLFGSDNKSAFFIVGSTLWRSETNGNDLQMLFNNVDSSKVGFTADGNFLLVKIRGQNSSDEIRLLAYNVETKTSNELFNSSNYSQAGQSNRRYINDVTFSTAGSRVLMSITLDNSSGSGRKLVVQVVDLKVGNPVEVVQPLETIDRQELTAKFTPTPAPTKTPLPTTARSTVLPNTPAPTISSDASTNTGPVNRATELVSLILSPSGQRLAWLYDIFETRGGDFNNLRLTKRTRQLYTTDINGANSKLYYEDFLNNPTFSLNDERILGVLDNNDSTNSSSTRQLISIANDNKAYLLSDPYLASTSFAINSGSNQKVLYYQYHLGGDGSVTTTDYFVTDPKGEKRLRLSTRTGEITGFMWSPDNHHALVSSKLDSDLYRFSLINLDNGSEAEIWRGSSSSSLVIGKTVEFSPDGKWLAYELVPPGSSSSSVSGSTQSFRNPSIYLVNLENGRYDRQEFMRGAQSLAW